jgi:uncharacterized protein (DUF433 family)
MANNSSSNLIVNDNNVRSGKPTVYGTRLTVEDVISIIENDELDDYPYVTENMYRACLNYEKSIENYTN